MAELAEKTIPQDDIITTEPVTPGVEVATVDNKLTPPRSDTDIPSRSRSVVRVRLIKPTTVIDLDQSGILFQKTERIFHIIGSMISYYITAYVAVYTVNSLQFIRTPSSIYAAIHAALFNSILFHIGYQRKLPAEVPLNRCLSSCLYVSWFVMTVYGARHGFRASSHFDLYIEDVNKLPVKERMIMIVVLLVIRFIGYIPPI